MSYINEDAYVGIVPQDVSSSSYEHLKAIGFTACLGGDVLDEWEACVFQRSRKAVGHHRCPLAHPLDSQLAPQDESLCDVCGKAVCNGDVLWGCRLCNYDRCQSCISMASCPAGHPLEYQSTPTRRSVECDVCGKIVA